MPAQKKTVTKAVYAAAALGNGSVDVAVAKMRATLKSLGPQADIVATVVFSDKAIWPCKQPLHLCCKLLANWTNDTVHHWYQLHNAPALQ
jgi:hypothetical protein